MPNRIIKESICSSDNLDRLSWFEEVVFYRLIVTVDDYGRMDARPPILRAHLFPLKSVTDKQIADALQSMRSAGIVDLYVVDGRPYLQMRTWAKHQRLRTSRAKYPAPGDGKNDGGENLPQLAATRGKSPQLAANRRKSRPESNVEDESESEGESEAEAEANARACARESAAPAAAPHTGKVPAVADFATTANRSGVPNGCDPAPSIVTDGEAEALAAGIPRYQLADELARRYNLPDCDPSRDALLEDFETYGEQAVEDALREACASNSRAKLSVKFYRAVLARGQPGATPYPGASNGPPRTNNVFAELLRREGGGGA